MSTSVKIRVEGNLLFIDVAGKIDKSDYEVFLPQIEKLLQSQEKIRMVVDLSDFDGWTLGALWEDLKFDARHFNDIERLAILGDSTREKIMTQLCKPFTTATVRYFQPEEREEALRWIRGDDAQAQDASN